MTDLLAKSAITQIIAAHPPRQDALLPILHDIQSSLGWVPPEATRMLADALNLSRAEVHGVISFYHEFRTTPPGRHVLQICRAEACQAMGSEALAAHAQKLLNITDHATSADGSVTLEAIYCLGNCACAPSLKADDEIHGRMDAARLEALLTRLRDGQPRGPSA